MCRMLRWGEYPPLVADVPLFRRQTTNKWSSPPLNIQLPHWLSPPPCLNIPHCPTTVSQYTITTLSSVSQYTINTTLSCPYCFNLSIYNYYTVPTSVSITTTLLDIAMLIQIETKNTKKINQQIIWKINCKQVLYRYCLFRNQTSKYRRNYFVVDVQGLLCPELSQIRSQLFVILWNMVT